MDKVSISLSISVITPIVSRDSEVLEESSSMLNLTSLGVSSQGNYSCAGVNYLGAGESGSLILDITGEKRFSVSVISYINFQPLHT